MNPLILLLLGLGGFMAAGGSGATSTTTSTTSATREDPVADDDIVDTPSDSNSPPPGVDPVAPATIDIELVVYDWANGKAVLTEIENGDTIDLGTGRPEDFVIGAEIDGGVEVGSVIFSSGNQSWLENVWRYTLSEEAGATEGGTFEVSVTAYSGTNGTGAELGSQTFNFETLIDIIEDEETTEVETGADDAEDQGSGEAETGASEEQEQEQEQAEVEAGAQAQITLVVYDWSNPDAADKAVLHELDGDGEIDLGTALASMRMVGAEIDGVDTVGSVVFRVDGEDYIENNARYTLPQDAGVTEGGTFDIEVTVYSQANGTGDVLGTQTFSVDMLIEAPEVQETEEELNIEDEDTSQDDGAAEDGAGDDSGDTGSGNTGSGNTGSDDDDTSDATPPPPPVADENPTPPSQGGDGGAGGDTDPVIIDGTVKAVAGRVTTLEPEADNIESLEIVSGLSYGKVTVNPDNTFAVVLTMSDKTSDQSFTYKATYADGSVKTHKVNLDVVKGAQGAGWATGESHYMLETDDDDKVVVETGDNHTKVYITDSNKGLSASDIARMEGISASQIDGEWLAANGRYGQSENLALDQNMGMELWNEITPRGSVTSNHLLLERGHDYGDLGRILHKGTYGEDELKPLYIGAWGDESKPDPKVTGNFRQDGDGTTNLVVQDVEFAEGLTFAIGGGNLLFDDISLTSGGSMVLMHQDAATVRNSTFIDAAKGSPKRDDWNPMDDRKQALFGNFNDGLRLEGNFFDLTGWEIGYAEDGSNQFQTPSMFSHNMYIGADNTDVTLRDTISMRASSYGANIRPGGFFEDNVLIDNNAGFNNLGGDYRGDGPADNYALFNSNIITSGAYKDADEMIGARAWGLNDKGEMSTLVDNIVAHMADPNNDSELDYKIKSEFSYGSDSAYYDDTIVYNWHGAEPNRNPWETEQNVEGLDRNVLDQTTIQLFTSQLLGKQDATIGDLADYLRAQSEGAFDDVVDADLIIRFFQEGFGIAADIRTDAETLRFVPNDLGDGVRWDNRLNWSTEDLPGQVEGDSVDLGGNTVIFNGNGDIEDLEFGPDGRLEIYGGKLTVAGDLTTQNGDGEVFIDKAGQLWADGHSGTDLTIDIDGGRIANTGVMTDASLDVNDAEAILATGGAIWGVSDGETLKVTGDQKIGFDDDDGGVALLALEQGGTLHFDVDGGKLSTIEEFRSGAFGDSPDVRSGIDLGNGTLKLDLAGLNATNGQELMLLDADEIIGAFDDVDVSGLGGRNAKVVIDYVKDKVSLELSSGNGQVSFQTVGQSDNVSAGEQALWDALTAGQGVFDENIPDIPEDEEEYLEAS